MKFDSVSAAPLARCFDRLLFATYLLSGVCLGRAVELQALRRDTLNVKRFFSFIIILGKVTHKDPCV
jgi:hypothetical protein